MVDRLRNSEANTRRIQNVEMCFGSSGRPLLMPGRVLVGEGVLVKMCRKKPKARQFFLFNDILVYGSILISKKRYSKQHVIPLEDVKLENLEDEGDARNGWLIKTRTKSFVVYAATPTEKREWMLHIERCVQDLINTGKVPPADYAALWIPDKEANKCMCCQTSHFSVIQRRHHCRACGKVVCSGCSSKSFVLEGISKKPVRVCDTCYNKLCQGMRTKPAATAILGQRLSAISTDDFMGAPSGVGRTDAAVDYSSDSETEANERALAEREEPTFYDPAGTTAATSPASHDISANNHPLQQQRQVEI